MDPYIEVPRSEDCFKHLVLVCLLGEMTSEQEGFTYVDAHAGRLGVWRFGKLWGLGFRVWGLGFRGVQALGFSLLGLRIWGFRVWSSGFGIWVAGFRIWCLESEPGQNDDHDHEADSFAWKAAY